MKIVKLLLMFCLFHLTLIAQPHFDPGYIINHNRDTIKGFIRAAAEGDLNSSIRFKKEIDGDLKEYNPADLLGFGIDQEIYRSIRFRNTIEGNRKDTVFVRQLVAGEYNLFTYLKSTRRYFLLQKDTSLYLLYDESFRSSGEVEQVSNYQNYLNFISVPCDKLKNKYTQIGYDEKSISDFVLATNNCNSAGSSTSFYQKQKMIVTPTVFVGGLPLGQESQLTANFILQFTFPHVDRQASLNIGLNYSNTTYMMAYSKSLNTNYQYYTREQITSIPFTVQYNVTQSRVQPYFYFGFSYAHITKDNLASGYWVQPNENYYGFSVVAGLGIEARIVSGLYARADWRYELFMQYPAIGLSYHF
jgi:hypothetical protein